jgi:mRNA interferase MazF
LNFDPQAGHEQHGRRPAFVVSPASYNSKTGLALVCPITSKIKDYPFEIAVRAGGIAGAVLSDQVRSLDWIARKAKFAAKTDARTLEKAVYNINLLLNPGKNGRRNGAH